ncbi:alpha/beta fold hydrolase [Telluribacter sp. SYSU D00476]|uniref:alpha/beta fold hydrolase n=1 Tax=Telluribacter sp. SYSU D00476 TaxID=2811430 RepID=UPI001FF20825|nr:alpha/beta hydrolase [Telluribacter sp. SYSU D00476]
MTSIRFQALWVRWSMATLLVLLVVLWWLAQRVEYRYSDEDIKNHFSTLSIDPQIHRYKIEDRTVRYVEFGADSLPVTIMVHGAPSSLSFFTRFYEDTALLRRTMLVGVDRPGYGYSDFGKSVISVSDQARYLQPIINRYAAQGRKVVLAASSYGGAVVAKLAMNNPDKVSGILFVSSSLAPGQEYTYPISYAIASPWFRWFFPTLVLVANDEKLSHQKALEDIQDGWERIQSKIILLHGKADGLIYYSNAEYAQKRLINATSLKLVPLEGIGHTILWDRPDLIRESLLELITPEKLSELARN